MWTDNIYEIYDFLDENKIKSTIQNMNIAYINYQFLKDFLMRVNNGDWNLSSLERKNIKFSQKKLIEWMINELVERKIAI